MDKKKEYKGLYNHDNNDSVTYYEFGAHFSYKALYNRLELILKNKDKNKNISICNKKIFSNLKKANSQKILGNQSDKIQKMNLSRNSKTNRKYIYDKLINKNKLCKSKSINNKLEISKSFNDDLFGSFSSYKNNKNKNEKNNKILKQKEIISKKNFENNKKKKILLYDNTNKNRLKNKHTILKNIIMPKKNINQNQNDNLYENYLYGFQMSKNNNDSEIYHYGDSSFNSTGNTNIQNRINSFNKIYNSSKNKKTKISSIINKKFIQKLINNSPKNNYSFVRSNTSEYYSQKKNGRMSEHNIFNCNSYKKQKIFYSKKMKHNNSDVDFDSKNLSKNKDNDNDNNNYYIENDNFFGFYHNSNIFNKNILLSNNIKQKNRKLTIFNNFNKIHFQKNENVNYLNRLKNPVPLGEKMKIVNSNSNQKIDSDITYYITRENKENSFINSNQNMNIYNSTSNFKDKSKKKRIIKNYNSHSNILNSIKDNNKYKKRKESHNDFIDKTKKTDTFIICADEQNSDSKNKKSRNNNTKNIVNLLCCHFSINFNSPINLLNNIQNNTINNDINKNNKTPKISSNAFNLDSKNEENNNINSIKSRNIKKEVNKKVLNNKNDKIKKLPKIPIHVNKGPINKKIIKKNSNSNFLNKKGNNSFSKKKLDNNIYKARINSSNNKIDKVNKNGKIIKENKQKLNRQYSNNGSNNNYSINSISTSRNININNNV